MDVWFSLYNTTTQGLNDFISRSTPDEAQKKYLIEKYNQLVGSLKLFVALDQRIGLTDNHIIDSGLIRGLFKYSNDSTIARLKDEFKDTLRAASNKIIWVHDQRVGKDDPASLIRERFELTRKTPFRHSAAFGNEANWDGISTYDDLVQKLPEYKVIFDFLTDLLARIPRENIVANPQKPDTYGLMLDYYYDIEKRDLEPAPGSTIYTYLKEYPEPAKRNRSNLYSHIEKSLDPDTAAALKFLFADQIYNRIAARALGDRFKFEEWNYFAGTPEVFNKVYKEKAREASADEQRAAVQRLYDSGKLFNMLAAQDISIISSVSKKVHTELMKEKGERPWLLARKTLWALYSSSHGDEINHQYTNAGLDLMAALSESMTPIKSFGFVVPILRLLHDSGKLLKFLYLTSFNSEYRDLIDVIERSLTKE